MPMNKQSSHAAILSLVNHCLVMLNMDLSYDAASGREIMPCIKIDKPYGDLWLQILREKL